MTIFRQLENYFAFLGSTEVGQILRKATAGSGKKISLELGGKSPFLVFDSADLDAAVEGVVDAIYFNQGQVRSKVISMQSRDCHVTGMQCWESANCSGEHS